MENHLEIKRKKILYRSRYRGTKELDLLIGAFINKHVSEANESLLTELEELLFMPDAHLQSALLSADETSLSPIVNKLKQFSKNYLNHAQ